MLESEWEPLHMITSRYIYLWVNILHFSRSWSFLVCLGRQEQQNIFLARVLSGLTSQACLQSSSYLGLPHVLWVSLVRPRRRVFVVTVFHFYKYVTGVGKVDQNHDHHRHKPHNHKKIILEWATVRREEEKIRDFKSVNFSPWIHRGRNKWNLDCHVDDDDGSLYGTALWLSSITLAVLAQSRISQLRNQIYFDLRR